MFATFRFKSGHKITIKCKKVSIKFDNNDAGFTSYQITGLTSSGKYENPLYMHLKEIESVTTRYTLFEKIRGFVNRTCNY
jgi:hypothetical protein